MEEGNSGIHQPASPGNKKKQKNGQSFFDCKRGQKRGFGHTDARSDSRKGNIRQGLNVKKPVQLNSLPAHETLTRREWISAVEGRSSIGRQEDAWRQIFVLRVRGFKTG